jgi:hypothetical protein
MSDQHEQHPQHVWEHGWEEHERLQRQRLAKLPLAEKLRWLEEMQRMVEHLRKQRESRDHSK